LCAAVRKCVACRGQGCSRTGRIGAGGTEQACEGVSFSLLASGWLRPEGELLHARMLYLGVLICGGA